MASDTEPRYRLVDSNGNVVGSLYAEADGTLKLQEGTSGSDNEVSVATDGTFTAPAVSTGDLTINNSVSGASTTEYRTTTNISTGTGKTFDTGISAGFNGVVLTANFKRTQSGAVGQYAWLAYSVDTRSPALISSNTNGVVSNATVKAPNGTFELQFDADVEIEQISGVVIGFGR